MFDINALRQERGEIVDRMAALVNAAEADKRDLTNDEATTYDALKASAATLDARIKRAEDVEREAAARATPADRGAAGNGIPQAALRGGAPAYFPASLYGGVREAREAAYRSGMWLRSALYGDAAAAQWCADNGIGAVRGAQREGLNPAGGFLVPTEFETAIIDLRETFGAARQLLAFRPMASDAMTVPRAVSGLTAYPVGEASELTESEKAWNQVGLTARKWGVLTYYSSELAEDAVISIASDLARDIGLAFADAEDTALFNGDGTSTYHGIVGIRTKMVDGSHDASSPAAASAHDTFAEYDAVDLATLMASLPARFQSGASFICSQVAKAMVFDRLAMAAGGNTTLTIGGRTVSAYNGYPIVLTEKMPVALTDLSDTVVILFGRVDLAVLAGERRGITIALSEHVKFTSDQFAIRGIERFDINVYGLGDNTTAGPLVGLEAE